MIWHRLSVLASLFPAAARSETAKVSRRWRLAVAEQPQLQADLIRLGGVLNMQTVRLENGYPELEPMDAHRLAYEAGRRDFALQLLALSGLTTYEMNGLMKGNDDEE